MAIPSKQIGQPSSTKAALLWEISKQLESLTKVAGNVYIPTTPVVSTDWIFTAGETNIFPTSSTGYTVYSGPWTQYDDGQTVDTFPLAGNFFYNNDGGRNTMFLSTNGFALASDSSYQINGNAGDLFLTPTDPLDDGDIQNFFYKNTNDPTKWKTSILVYCGHCCGSPQEQTPYSYILNIYQDTQYQYIEACAKTNVANNAGPNGNEQPANILTQVWQSDLTGSSWTYLGFGSISGGGGCPECPTTTTTTTANPGPTPTYTGKINISTETPGNELFSFRILSQDNSQWTTATINWGDNTSDFYNIPPDSYVYFNHTYSSNALWEVNFSCENPAQILTFDLDRNSNESPAVVTGYDFRDLDGINRLNVGNNDALHIASTVGLFTLTQLHANNADLESLSLLDGANITTLVANNNNLSVLDLTSATSLQYVELLGNQLLSVDISDSPNITYLDLSDNALSQAGVDNVLLSLVGNNQTNGYLDLRGTANDAPSSTGLSTKATLEARGWTVYVNSASGVQSTLMYYTYGGTDSYQALCYYDIADSKYVTYRTAISGFPAPRTVYYMGTLGINTVLWTNPEMTQFDINLFNQGYEVGVIFTDVALNPTDVNGSLQVYTLSYYGPSPNTVYTNPGTVATVSWNRKQFKVSSNFTYCDSPWSNDRFILYQDNVIAVGTRISENYGNGNWQSINDNYLTEYINPINIYTSNGYTITNIQACQNAPVFNGASWGLTEAEAISGVNTFNIKASSKNPWNGISDYSFAGCDAIRLTNGNNIWNIITSYGPFWVVYDGVIKKFGTPTDYYYDIAEYDRYNFPAVTLVNPPVTPYEFVLSPGSCASSFNPGAAVTMYSNFATIQKYTAFYTDAARTTTPSWDWYTPASGTSGYMYYDKVFFTQIC